MGKFSVQKNILGINGVHIIEPQISDNREFFYETYNESDFMEKGLTYKFVQDNEVFSKKGVLRGMHVNIKYPQGKLIRVTNGRIYDVIIDLRKKSKTYKKWFGIELSSNNRKQIYIPEGMGHGYLALEDSTVLFKVTTHYVPNSEMGFAWNSREFGITWPIDGIELIQNDNDRGNKDYSEMEK